LPYVPPPGLALCCDPHRSAILGRCKYEEAAELVVAKLPSGCGPAVGRLVTCAVPKPGARSPEDEGGMREGHIRDSTGEP
jgi:hypothetical protein